MHVPNVATTTEGVFLHGLAMFATIEEHKTPNRLFNVVETSMTTVAKSLPLNVENRSGDQKNEDNSLQSKFVLLVFPKMIWFKIWFKKIVIWSRAT